MIGRDRNIERKTSLCLSAILNSYSRSLQKSAWSTHKIRENERLNDRQKTSRYRKIQNDTLQKQNRKIDEWSKYKVTWEIQNEKNVKNL
jgi:hypothetical protein